MNKRLYLFIFSGLFVGVAVFFQNCSTKTNQDASSGPIVDITSQPYARAPFAFSAKIDQISYMSCHPDTGMNHPAFYSFKMGGYYSGGIKIRDEFIKYVKNNVKPLSSNKEIVASQALDVLSQSNFNKGAIPQVAIRSRFNFQSALGTQGATVGTDIIQILGDLSSSNLASSLIRNSMFASRGATIPSYVRYFPYSDFAGTGQMRFDAVLKFLPTSSGQGIGESTASMIRTALGPSASANTAGILTLAYSSDSPDLSGARTPTPNIPKSAFGSGFNITFDKPSISGFQTNRYVPVHVIKQVSEFDLERPTSVDATSWDCTRKYLIVRKEDVEASQEVCQTLSVNELTDVDRSELEIAHNALLPEYWEVNPRARCAYPKDTGVSCYDEKKLDKGDGSIPTHPGVAYRIDQDCFRQLDDTGTVSMNYGGTIPTRLCAEFVSICVRQ